jgi:putative ABC transport system permease protein
MKPRVLVPMLQGLTQDLRYGLRGLRKSPGFTATTLLMLALGIGINTTVFCWLEALVWRPLPGVRAPQDLVSIIPSYRGDFRFGAFPYPDFDELTKLDDVFDGVLGSAYADAILSIHGRSEWVFGRLVTANAFEVLGVNPERGRFFLPGEDRGEGAHPVLVVSHAFWQRRLGGSAEIIGTTIWLNRHPFTIVGVAPEDFRNVQPSDLQTDFWAPISMHSEILNFGSFQSRTFRWVVPLARLRRGVSLERAQIAAATLSTRLEQEHPESNRDVRFKVFPLPRSPLGPQAVFLPILRLLAVVGLCVLLIVIVNVANLQLSRATSREKEVVTRLAIGGSPARIIRQILTESLLLAGFGAVLGIVLAEVAVGVFPALVPKTNLPVAYHFRLNPLTLVLTCGLAAITAILFGMAPVAHLRRLGLAESLAESGRRSGDSRRQSRLRSSLVAFEVSLASLLLIGAVLCAKGLEKAKQIDLGFDPRNLVCAELNLVPSGYSVAEGKAFDRRLRQRLAVLPTTEDVSLATVLPLGDRTVPTAAVDVEGHASGAGEDRLASLIMVSPGYFQTMRIPILEGRDFTDQDGLSTRNVAIIDQTMALKFWPRASPVGRQFRMAAGVAAGDAFTVVGVVRSGKYRSLTEPPTPLVYLQYEQRPMASLFMSMVVRTRDDPARAADQIRREIRSEDPQVEPITVQPLESYIEPAYAQVRIGTKLLGVLGATALMLAALGLYGVMSYIVGRRTHEIGIRVALGARNADVFRLVTAQTMTIVLIGEGLGFVFALAATRLLANVLYGVSPTDPEAFGGAFLLFIAVALVANWNPVRRAMRVDPAIALRAE